MQIDRLECGARGMSEAIDMLDGLNVVLLPCEDKPLAADTVGDGAMCPLASSLSGICDRYEAQANLIRDIWRRIDL